MVSQTQPRKQVAAPSGLRPLNPLRDLSAVADLVSVAFSRELEGGSRYIMRDLRMLHTMRPLMWLVSQISPSSYDFLDGFVWEEEGRVVGNLSLSQMYSGAWIVSNVAVMPTYRRRGIARAMMRAAIERVRDAYGSSILLQVHEKNLPAVALYESLNFEYLDTVVELRGEQLKPSNLPVSAGVTVVEPIEARWYEAYEVARVANSAVRLGRAVASPSTFRLRRVGRLERLWQKVVPPAKERWWAMEENEVRGLLTLRRRGGPDADYVEILLAPSGEGRVESALTNKLTERLRGRAVVHLALPRTQAAARAALVEAGFVETRVLNQMRLTLSSRRIRSEFDPL